MPELPEVETTLKGIQPGITGQTIREVILRHRQLRWPIPQPLPTLLARKKIIGITRRAKYLLVTFRHGTLLIHLGMSGCLRLLADAPPPRKHDHIDIVFTNGTVLRYTDPR